MTGIENMNDDGVVGGIGELTGYTTSTSVNGIDGSSIPLG
jgi:hypothetical protein